MAILKSTIEMAESKSLMAPVLAIDMTGVSLAAGAPAPKTKTAASEAVTLRRSGDETGEQRLR